MNSLSWGSESLEGILRTSLWIEINGRQTTALWSYEWCLILLELPLPSIHPVDQMSIQYEWQIHYSLFRHVKIILDLSNSCSLACSLACLLACLRFRSSLDCLFADSNLNIEVRKLAFEILLMVDAYSVRRHIASLRFCKSRPRARFIRLCTVDRALMNFPIFYSAAGVAIAESQPPSPPSLSFYRVVLFAFVLILSRSNIHSFHFSHICTSMSSGILINER